MALPVHEILVAHLLELPRAWPALATGQRGFTWDDHCTYVSYARLLLTVALLRRGPHVPMARLVLQKARAMHCAGLAHQMRVELICLRDITYVQGATWLDGPFRSIGESDATWQPTAQDREEVLCYVDTDSEDD
jgi:hypothetical protein